MALLIAAGPYMRAQQIPKGSDRIELRAKYNNIGDAVTGVARVLMGEGIAIDKYDRDMGFINAGPITRKNVSVYANLFFEQKDSAVVVLLSGNYKLVSTIHMGNIKLGEELDKVLYKGMRGSIVRDAWDALYSVVDRIPHEGDPAFHVPQK